MHCEPSMNKYFISFEALYTVGANGYSTKGNWIVHRNMICGEEDIRSIEKEVGEKTGYKSVTVLYWKRFECDGCE